jgi:mannose-6-phosphate isomerase-like protein (cupin superfamily)
MPSAPGPFVVCRAQPRRGSPLKIFSDSVYVKLGAADTGGRYSLIEDVTPAGAGTALHVHHREDEGFYVVEGDYLFEASGQRFEVHTGDFVFVPKDTPHRFLNIGQSSGTMLLTLEPGGLEIFFEELAAIPGPPDPGLLAPVFEKYGLELLGPPLNI